MIQLLKKQSLIIIQRLIVQAGLILNMLPTENMPYMFCPMILQKDTMTAQSFLHF